MPSRFSSHAVARRAGLVVIPTDDVHGVHRDGEIWLKVGPDATDDEIVSVACRCMVERALGRPSEDAVRVYARKLGYEYVAPVSPAEEAETTRAKLLRGSDLGMSKRYVRKLARGLETR